MYFPKIGNRNKFKNLETQMATFAILVLFYIGASPVGATLYDDRDALNKEINHINARLTDIRTEKVTLSNEVAVFDNQIYKTQLEINATQHDLDITMGEINSIVGQIEKAEEDLKKQKILMGEYLKTMYIEGQTSTIELVVKSNTFSDFVNRSEYLGTMQQKVQETAEKISLLKEELEEKKKEQEVKKAQIEVIKTKQVAQRQALDNQRSAKNDLLSQTKGLESAFQGLLTKEKQMKADLDNQIRQLEYSKYGTVSQSGYSWPFPGYSRASLVYGVGSFIPFGNSIHYFPGVFHTGIDIYGSAISSASDGIVVLAGPNGGYGNCVIVRNGNHLVIYGHLSSIGVSTGQTVGIGTYLGQEGTTGWSTGNHLHFEIRDISGGGSGTPVDPLNYLP